MPKSKTLILATFLFATFVASCSNNPTDDTITTDIKAKMFSEPSLKSAAISVTAKDGVVTLSGNVPDDAARETARRIASQTPGVKQVIDTTTAPAPASSASTESVQNLAPKPTPPSKSPARPPSKTKPPKKEVVPDAAPQQPPAQDSSTTAPPVTSTDVGPPAVAPKPEMPTPPPPPPPPQPIAVTVPSGTIVSVRTIDAIDSKTNHTGQRFRASLDSPIVVGNNVVIPKGLNVNLKLVNASSAGKIQGRSELTVSLESFYYQGKSYQVATTDVQEQGASRGKRSAAVIGGGAVLGAIIGGIAGGGKGAAIGAAAGGGTGAAVQVLTKGQQVKIPAETRLDFTLHDPVDITYLPPKRTPRANPAPTTPSDDSAQPSAPAPTPTPQDAPPPNADKPQDQPPPTDQSPPPPAQQ
jgi:BON domain